MQLKRMLDPNNILNPNKIFSAEQIAAAEMTALEQGRLISDGLATQSIELAPDSELTAIIAYMQRQSSNIIKG